MEVLWSIPRRYVTVVKRHASHMFVATASHSQCVPFDYTGCGGNLNNFVSMMDCMATCGNVGFRR
ncbi:Kunitz/Bovine pancreatic trypsin inhibitor domain protein [Ancylostoma duodenale]|uniref:Kunitz/Bovine pancreatic trypsin inhibitor domain protein n=1 Tax=Ancylostoma duodenale TaxID=51022 RepID=A0A0C2GH48_9BILA|nr:Kunitz/Bovine pancreatic trypsin inhibitor domain protein [Ancylostoma duodenale]